MIRLNASREIIGAVGISPPDTVADLAIWMFAPYRRKGYGTSAFALTTKYAIETLGISELHAGAYPDDIGSIKMLARCGYTPYPAGNVAEKHYITGEDIVQLDYIYKPETTVRRIVSEDLDTIIPGIVHVFRDDEVLPWHRPKECAAWVSRRAERGFYITAAFSGDKLVGYSEWIETVDRGKRLLYLGIMQVDCDLRGRGIGGAMLADGAKHAKEVDAEYLRTIPEDERSAAFYRKYGFSETDTIYRCVRSTVRGESVPDGAPAAVTLDVSGSHEFILGLSQSSGRHMYEVANHNPDDSEFNVITSYIPNGYLHFRYRDSSSTATALYWSNADLTAATVSMILARGHAEGFGEVEFIFRSKYLSLFAGYVTSLENIELERRVAQ
jgi:RimJ/RimL family protein N-acetyltransferase